MPLPLVLLTHYLPPEWVASLSGHVQAITGPVETTLGATRLPLEILLRQSDFASLHAPLTQATRSLINASTLQLMKPFAVLINTARGPIVGNLCTGTSFTRGMDRRSSTRCDRSRTSPTQSPALYIDELLDCPPYWLCNRKSTPPNGGNGL
jgi:hypothetical protein